MYWFYAITGVALVFSLVRSKEKTLKALMASYRRLVNILPAFMVMLVLVSLVLFLIPEEVISYYLGVENKFAAVLTASFLGSVTLMPGFIAYPLAGILLTKGVSYMVLSAFTTTLMMVGVLTYPIEKQYFGSRVTVMRNAISLLIALIIAVITGFFFGEVFC
ncbi:MAG TPA: hypothetical protein EYP71_06250 [Dehalococcoidia bacterium]|nr:hypothetical protein [Dehalococcoidia bacterium]